MSRHTARVDNAAIADRLDAFASLLELADANPYTARAYRRAAETIRGAPVPVADLVRVGAGARAARDRAGDRGAAARARRDRRDRRAGGARARARAGARRPRPLPRADREALDRDRAGARRPHAPTSCARRRRPGRLRTVPGVGPKIEARLLEALARAGEPRPRAGSCSTARASSSAGIAAALGGELAGDARRWRDSCEHLAVVCAARRPAPVLDAVRRAAADRRAGRARRAARGRRHGRGRAGRARRRRAGAVRHRAACARPARPPTSPRSSRSRTRPTRRRSTRALGIPWCPPELREAPFRGEPPRARRARRHPRRPALPHDVVGRARERGGDGPRRPRPRLRVPRDLRPHARGRRRPGPHADDVRRQAEEIAAANEALAPFRVLRGIECDILPDGRLDLPDDVLAELDWVQASVHGGQRMPRARDDQARRGGAAQPARPLPQPPDGPATSTAGPENAVDLDRVFEVALEHGVAIEVNGLPDRLDLQRRARPRRDRGRREDRLLDRRALGPRARRTWQLAVATARRGGATAADVVNAGPLALR